MKRRSVTPKAAPPPPTPKELLKKQLAKVRDSLSDVEAVCYCLNVEVEKLEDMLIEAEDDE